MVNIDAVGNAPPAHNPVAQPPAAGMAAIFDAWAETQNVQENEPLRADLTADIYRDRGELRAPYVWRRDVGRCRVDTQFFFLPLGRVFFPTHLCCDRVNGGRPPASLARSDWQTGTAGDPPGYLGCGHCRREGRPRRTVATSTRCKPVVMMALAAPAPVAAQRPTASHRLRRRRSSHLRHRRSRRRQRRRSRRRPRRRRRCRLRSRRCSRRHSCFLRRR